MNQLEEHNQILMSLQDKYEMLKKQSKDLDQQMYETLMEIDGCRRTINTISLLNNISNFDPQNVISASIHDIPPSTKFFQKFLEGSKSLLLIRQFVHWNHIPLGLLISKIDECNINIRDCKSTKLTASYVIKKEQIYVHSQENAFRAELRPKGERERFLIEEILKLESRGVSPETICRPTAFELPCAFYAQPPQYRESGYFGDEYYGDRQTKQGGRYGDAIRFACIGVVPYECYNTPEIRSTEY